MARPHNSRKTLGRPSRVMTLGPTDASLACASAGLEPVGRGPKPWADPGFLRLAHSENLIRQDDVGIACLDAALGRRLAKVQTIKESRAIHARRLFDVRLAWTNSDQ